LETIQGDEEDDDDDDFLDAYDYDAKVNSSTVVPVAHDLVVASASVAAVEANQETSNDLEFVRLEEERMRLRSRLMALDTVSENYLEDITANPQEIVEYVPFGRKRDHATSTENLVNDGAIVPLVLDEISSNADEDAVKESPIVQDTKRSRVSLSIPQLQIEPALEYIEDDEQIINYNYDDDDYIDPDL
jgi:hypothetical protein